MPKQKVITRTIWILSWISLCTDMASEMLYPVMPAYLRSIGFTIAAIGILEGVAEMVAGLGKAWFGAWSDHSGKRVPFVRAGYGLSALAKPMLALSTALPWVFAARTADRVGKGLRTGARDAILNQEAGPEHKATVFGFHRSMDTLGAVIGPTLALVYLFIHPGAYRQLFWIAFIPGLAAILLTFLLHDRDVIPNAQRKPFGLMKGFRYWRDAPTSYRKLLLPLLIFALVNSSDMLLLLRMRESGRTDGEVVFMYIFYNIVYAALAYPVGKFADRTGVKRTFVTGLIAFAVVYGGFGFASSTWAFAPLLVLYGFYAAATDGIAKAWIGKIVLKEEAASAIGTYAGFQSIAALLAGIWTGLVWQYFGAAWAFGTAGVVSIFVALMISNRGPDSQI